MLAGHEVQSSAAEPEQEAHEAAQLEQICIPFAAVVRNVLAGQPERHWLLYRS